MDVTWRRRCNVWNG